MRGGWGNITAEEATILASYGCTQPFEESVTEQPFWSEPEFGGSGSTSGGVAYPDVTPSPGDPPQENVVDLAQFFAGTDMETTPAEFGWTAPSFAAQGGLIGEVVKGAAQALGGELLQEAIPQFGVTVTPGQACWDRARATGKVNRRMRVKLQRMPDGSVQVVRYCAPKRMNPCNPRALGRAARRLSMFQKMSSGIEKLINKQLKRRAPSRMSYGRSCGPKKGCR